MTLLALAAVAVLVVGYLGWGRIVASRLGLDDTRPTPAVARADGVDFVPTPRFYLLSQHFSAIAAAGPIAGPILAAQLYGWGPALLWIALGVVLIGAVHDLSALLASVRHRAATIAELMREHVGRGAWMAMMGFIWVALGYVLVAFTDITAATFVGAARELPDGTSFHPGGAVAFASVAYLSLALAMGLLRRRWPQAPLWLWTALFVPATGLVVWLGTLCSDWLVADARTWGFCILAYCFVASLLPVWLLLQPRGYLGGFVLYAALGAGLVGMFLLDLPIEQPAFRTWQAPGPTGALFPFLFVTIACGACSGFHGLVCSGTTSKQIARESDCKPVGYGGMLLEGLVAVIALSTVVTALDGELTGKSPGRIYGDGLGRFVAAIVGPEHLLVASTFGAMAFSTFVFDTIDVAARLGRYVLQELFGWRSRASAVLATALTLAPPALALALTETAPGKPPAYTKFWTLFGTSNQLLAALTLLGVLVWLRAERRPSWFVALPCAFVLAMTLWALLVQLFGVADPVLRLTAAALLALALYVCGAAARALWRSAIRPRGTVSQTAG
ncbi:MAG: carbon starvation protein A [Myxococcota bacterium]|nr:carbon starvation protein A [Myxococcota bacterium]MDW8362722.1 carbon starvation CstA family protein [Myxococcales bacterium]